MKRFFKKAAVFLLLIMSGVVAADEQGYRIAGIITLASSSGEVIVELPDGEQRLLNKGDFLGEIEVIQILKDAVVLRFPDGEKQLQLSQGDYIPFSGSFTDTVEEQDHLGDQNQEVPSDVLSSQQRDASSAVTSAADSRSSGSTGVLAADFSKLIDKRLDPGLLVSLRGLETLSELSDSARIVSYSYVGDPDAVHIQIDTQSSGASSLIEAIAEGNEVRITVEDDPSYSNFYLMPDHVE